MQIVVDQLLTNYHLAGNGKLVVLVHGWGDSSKSWAALQAELAKQYQVLAFDLPGFGGTQAPTDDWGLDHYALFAAGLVKKLGLQPYALIGHSNGGAIALRGLSTGTLKASKLVLLASAGIRNQHNGRNRVLRVAAKTTKALIKPLPQRMQRKLRGTAYKKIGSDMLVAEHLQETFKRVVTDDVRADAKHVTIPSLLIYGTQDTATPLRYGELLQAALPHAKLETIAGAGHFVYLDEPVQVLDLIEEFLR
jgi:pimeloyl-ACP methyl ester carboxylesterase